MISNGALGGDLGRDRDLDLGVYAHMTKDQFAHWYRDMRRAWRSGAIASDLWSMSPPGYDDLFRRIRIPHGKTMRQRQMDWMRADRRGNASWIGR